MLFCRVVGRPERPAENDAKMFVYARRHILALVDEVERLRAALAELTSANPPAPCLKNYSAHMHGQAESEHGTRKEALAALASLK